MNKTTFRDYAIAIVGVVGGIVALLAFTLIVIWLVEQAGL